MAIEVQKLPLGGAFVIDPLRVADDRGVFMKLFTKEVLASQGVEPIFMEECLVSSNKDVLRGLHYQTGEYAQAKLATCVKGEVYDVIVDVRRNSKTYLKWASVLLSEDNRKILYAPRGFAHGYLCTRPDTLLIYKADNLYSSAHEKGIRWNDPTVGITWPVSKPILSEKDRGWADVTHDLPE